TINAPGLRVAYLTHRQALPDGGTTGKQSDTGTGQQQTLDHHTLPLGLKEGCLHLGFGVKA
ncbi:MAG: hypothetical protein AAGC58_02060, partial [Asticcacaulis sp.]